MAAQCIYSSWKKIDRPRLFINGLVQNSSDSIANALELLLSCTKPSISYWVELEYKCISSNAHKQQSGLRNLAIT